MLVEEEEEEEQQREAHARCPAHELKKSDTQK
jgi:hypothetical protein